MNTVPNTDQRPNTTLIFDWDGTLLDNRQAIKEAFKATCIKFKVPAPSEETLNQNIGRPAQDIAKSLFSTHDAATPGFSEIFFEDFRRHYLNLDVALFPQTKATLTSLQQAGYLLVIATNKRRSLFDLENQQHQLTHLWHSSHCGDEYTHKKPHPEMLLAIADNHPETQHIMIGDTDKDINAAKEAKIPSIAILNNAPACVQNTIHAAQPDQIIASISQLIITIEALKYDQSHA